VVLRSKWHGALANKGKNGEACLCVKAVNRLT
jgi:hypothetical protein